MCLANQWNCLSCQEINTCKQWQGSKPHILIIPTDIAVFLGWIMVRIFVGNSLNAGFFIIWNSMGQMPVVQYGDSSIIIKLHLHLFINQKDIMHFVLKIRIFTFKIIFNFERFNLHLFEIFLKPWLCNCF